jgi:hypothetical protein
MKMRFSNAGIHDGGHHAITAHGELARSALPPDHGFPPRDSIRPSPFFVMRVRLRLRRMITKTSATARIRPATTAERTRDAWCHPTPPDERPRPVQPTAAHENGMSP